MFIQTLISKAKNLFTKKGRTKMFIQTLISKAKNLFTKNRAAIKNGKHNQQDVIKIPSPTGPYKPNKPGPKPNRAQVRRYYNSQKGRAKPFPFIVKHGRAAVVLKWWREIGKGYAFLHTYDPQRQTVRVMFPTLGAHVDAKHNGKIRNAQGIPLSASVKTCHLSEIEAA